MHGRGDGGRISGSVQGRGGRGVAVVEGGWAVHGGLTNPPTAQTAAADEADDDDEGDPSDHSANQHPRIQPALLFLRLLGCAGLGQRRVNKCMLVTDG